MFKRILSFVSVIAIALTVIPMHTFAQVGESAQQTKGIEESSNNSIIIDAVKEYTTNQELTTQVIDGQEFIVTGDQGYIEWTFNVEKAAVYHIAAKWANVSGKGLDIMRTVYIDDKVPFDGMNAIYFRRKWKNQNKAYYDKSGNEYSLKLEEEIAVQTSPFYSLTDYHAGGYSLELTAGEHRLRFEAIQEPMAINSIILTPVEERKTYSEAEKEYKEKGYKEISKDVEPIIIEAENSTYTSKSTLRPVADRSSPAVVPYNPLIKKLNAVGGGGWTEAAQWIEWDFVVEKSGLYNIAFHAKQDYKSGFSSSRRLLIDGQSPFKEADYIEFDYSLNWQNVVLGGEKPYLVYLDKGKHTIRMEVSVTEKMAEIISISESLQEELIAIYRRIVMVTGTMPDTLRDYNLFTTVSGSKKTLEDCLKKLEDIVAKLEGLGYSGSETSSMNRLILQIEGFLEDDNTIPEGLDSFNTNIMTFSSWITSAAQQPLLLDSIRFYSAEAELPKADSGFLKKTIDELYRLLISFTKDYDVLDSATGNSENKEIKLWVGLGIDQSIVLKSLIDSTFTSKENINVNIELVNMGVLLRAVAAGVGPDVAMFQGQGIPVEYAMRGAVYDLKNFSDLDEVLGRFKPSAYESFKYEGGLYALPETQTFSMMFYRTDILNSLGIGVPNTWDELYAALAKLQTNHLSISVPTPFGGGAGTAGLNSVYMMLLYQNGAQLYTKDGKATALSEENGITAFTQWANLYTKYKIPQTTNILTRFRMGESPLVISDYTFYNQLQIGAPEIEGKWDIAAIPAMVTEDGTLNRSQASSVTGCLIFSNAKDKESSWKFLKWWTSAETQADYGIEIEALQGASARWATANIEAFTHLPWAKRISTVIETQWDNVWGVPQVAGGYYTARSIDNAIRSVVNEGENTRETILDFAAEIDEEITIKRQEFNLDTEE